MADLVKIIETSDDIEAQTVEINAFLATITPVAGSVKIAVDGGLHRCRIYIYYATT